MKRHLHGVFFGGAGVIKDEHPSVSVFSPSKASSISSSGDIVDAQRLQAMPLQITSLIFFFQIKRWSMRNM